MNRYKLNNNKYNNTSNTIQLRQNRIPGHQWSWLHLLLIPYDMPGSFLSTDKLIQCHQQPHKATTIITFIENTQPQGTLRLKSMSTKNCQC